MTIDSLYAIYRQFPLVETDTRKLQPGCIYFALKGANFDGNAFALQAIEQGAAYAVVDDPTLAKHSKCILVDEVITSLQALATYHRQQLNIPFLAITGSNGKTTTKELITMVLRRKYKTAATLGNLNNHIGVPLTILQIKPETEIAIIEMGANHKGEIASYCQIAQPTHALITNCGKAHIEGFGSEEGVRQAKGELYAYIRSKQGVIFRDTDLSYLEEMAEGIATQITYGTQHAMLIGNVHQAHPYVEVSVHTNAEEHLIRTQLVGVYNLPNILAAITIGQYFKVAIEDIQAAIEAYKPDNNRSQLLTANTNTIILDAYNANPTSMRAAIVNFASMDTFSQKILCLGAMKEMGETSAQEHKDLVAFINSYSWTSVILVGNEFKDYAGSHHWFADSTAAASYMQNHLPTQTAILIKGSRGSKMEEVATALLSHNT